MKELPRIIITRCFECDACQEFILSPASAPECSKLRVSFPDKNALRGRRVEPYGTERKAYRAIEQWARKHIRRGQNSINYVEVLWCQGTTVKPVLRKPFVVKKTKAQQLETAIDEALRRINGRGTNNEVLRGVQRILNEALT